MQPDNLKPQFLVYWTSASTFCLDQGTRGLERGLHIWQLRELGGDLEIANDIVLIDDHDGPREDMRIFDEKAVAFSKVAAAVIRQKRDVVDLRFLRKTRLGEGGIDADRDQLHVLVQSLVLFTE